MQEITWDEFFARFDDADLALVVQDESADGRTNNVNTFVNRSSGEEQATQLHRRLRVVKKHGHRLPGRKRP